MARYEVSIVGHFTARHRVPHPDGTLEADHEHAWNVKLTYAGDALDTHSMLIDFVPAQAGLDRCLARLDGQELNTLDWFADRYPTAECVAEFIAGHVQLSAAAEARLVAVEVEEAPGCVARYFPAPAGG